MSNLEHAFLQQIDAEPENALHRLVYADWLEEQGSEKAGQIRLWQQVVEAPVYEKFELLRQIHGTFEAVVQTLPVALRRRCACDIAWRVLPLFERSRPADLRPRQALIAAWRFSLGEIAEEELRTVQMQVETACAGLPFAIARMAGTSIAAAASVNKSDQIHACASRADFASHIAGEKQWQLLIAISYRLFGFTALPDRFTLEKARERLP